jgi:fatty-acyl-CoA synthase
MTTSAGAPPASELASSGQADEEQRIVEAARKLALEVSGPRAASAVTATASLERDIGLGSLERVELLLRLETVLGRELDDRFLLLDTPREIARALPGAPALSMKPAEHVAATALSPTALRLDDVTTIHEALRRRAAAEPGRVHIYLHDDTGARQITYGELWDGTARIAMSLATRGLRRGEPVAIMLPTGLDYLQAFMGVLAAGAVAVPLYPPARLDRMGEYLQRQARILANAGARLLIAMPEAAPVARLLRGAAPALETITTADALRSGPEPHSPPDVAIGGDVALIQYTSGSTGDPKGVALTHANLLANIRAITAGLEMRPTDVGVSWLPLYHDMGLIGTWLCTLVQAIPLALMSPLAFLARPERWLWTIHQRRATLSAAPNFAYELCVRKVRDEAVEGLDLSSWRCALNGSEPVSPRTLDRFARRFARHGFRREAFMPVYGLAESTVALCFPPLGRGPLVDRVAREPFAREERAVPVAADAGATLDFVSIGRPLPEHEVRVVDERGDDVPERVVGRVVFRGPSCMAGYYRNAEATAAVSLPGGWLDSGDLAYRAGGELFVVGRLKDLIIKSGRNLVPQEIEEVAGSIPGIRKGCVTAFGIPDEATGTERLVVLAESRAESSEERERLEREVVASVAAVVDVPPDVVRVVPPGAIPKTPSGKVRRSAAREAFETGVIGKTHRVPLRLRLGVLAGALAAGLRASRRSLLRGLYIGYLALATAAAAILLVPLLWVLARFLPPGRPVRLLSRHACRIALRIAGCRLEVEGAGRLPRQGPLVLVANHTSYADTPALIAALPIDLVFVAMQEILRWPLVGLIVRRAGHPTVDRWHPQRSVADATTVETRLRASEVVLFFPEGSFSSASGLRPFRLGAFEAAVAAGALVVPVALRGARYVLRAGRRFPRPGRIHVWVGEPIPVDGEGWRAALQLRDRAAEAIAAHCGEPRLDLAASGEPA